MSREVKDDGVIVSCDQPGGCSAEVRFSANDDELIKERGEELGWTIGENDDRCPAHGGA